MDNNKLIEILESNLNVNKRISSKLEEIDAILIDKGYKERPKYTPPVPSDDIFSPSLKITAPESLDSLMKTLEELIKELKG